MDKIICLGKNYLDHTLEMKEKAPDKPVLFIKPPSVFCEIKENAQIPLQWERGPIHHELEVVFKLYKKMVIGIGLGLDLTLRDLQKKLKENGHPWEVAKVFKNSALVTPMKAAKDFNDWVNTPFSLKINGEIKQQSKLSQAILTPDQIIHHANDFFQLCDGDLVFTGTPSGVGPLNPNDQIEIEYGPIHYRFKVI